jgi:hypothetical protein
MKNRKTLLSELIQSVSRVSPAIILCGVVAMVLWPRDNAFSLNALCGPGLKMEERQCPPWELRGGLAWCNVATKQERYSGECIAGCRKEYPFKWGRRNFWDKEPQNLNKHAGEKCEKKCREDALLQDKAYVARFNRCHCVPVFESVSLKGCFSKSDSKDTQECIYGEKSLNYDEMKKIGIPVEKLENEREKRFSGEETDEGREEALASCRASSDSFCDSVCRAFAPHIERKKQICCVEANSQTNYSPRGDCSHPTGKKARWNNATKECEPIG